MGRTPEGSESTYTILHTWIISTVVYHLQILNLYSHVKMKMMLIVLLL